MPTSVNVAPVSFEITEADLSNGHFWRLTFRDQFNGDTAHLTFSDGAFDDFLERMVVLRGKIAE